MFSSFYTHFPISMCSSISRWRRGNQKSSSELYREAAQMLGLSCTLSDSCRCLDCQVYCVCWVYRNKQTHVLCIRVRNMWRNTLPLNRNSSYCKFRQKISSLNAPLNVTPQPPITNSLINVFHLSRNVCIRLRRVDTSTVTTPTHFRRIRFPPANWKRLTLLLLSSSNNSRPPTPTRAYHTMRMTLSMRCHSPTTAPSPIPTTAVPAKLTRTPSMAPAAGTMIAERPGQRRPSR